MKKLGCQLRIVEIEKEMRMMMTMMIEVLGQGDVAITGLGSRARASVVNGFSQRESNSSATNTLILAP